MSTTLAFLLPWLAGTLLWQLILGPARTPAAWAERIGAGFLIGMLLFGVALRFAETAPTQALFEHVWPWLAGCVLLLAMGGWIQHRSVRDGAALAKARIDSARQRWLSIAISVVLTTTFVLLLVQSLALPALAWDSWNAWLAKSRGWYFANAFVPATSDIGVWLSSSPGGAMFVTAAHYPEAIPRLALWMAGASGQWNEAALRVLWPGVWAALGSMMYGYLRSIGASSLHAIATAAFVLLLPLVIAHASLTGYADLWLCALVLLAGVQLMRWFDTRNWRDALAAGVCLLLLPAVKLEGAVWLFCFLAVVLVGLMPGRWRRYGIAGAVLLWAVALPFGGWSLPLPGLGLVRLGWGSIDIPAIQTLQLSWRPVTTQVLQSLLLLPNWSLLWYLAPLVLVARWHRIGSDPGTTLIAGFLLCGYGFLFVLFFFTDAAAWAENFTSINRVLLHVVPLTVLWLGRLWLDPPAPRGTVPATPD